MSTSPKTLRSLSLDEFLRLPDIEEAPGLEFINGLIERKAMPTSKHNLIGVGFVNRLNHFALPAGIGLAEVEVRHTFAGRSILPDASFRLAENIQFDADDTPANDVRVPPDIHIEILSLDQSVPKTHQKLLHSTANGCALGLLVHPEKKTIDVYRAERTPERLADDGAIDFAPVLPGLVIPVAEVFSWMVVRLRRPGAEPA